MICSKGIKWKGGYPMSLDRLLKMQAKAKAQANQTEIGSNEARPQSAVAAKPESETDVHPLSDKSPTPATKAEPKKLIPFGKPKPKPAAPKPAVADGKMDFDLNSLGSLDLSDINESGSGDSDELGGVEGSGFFDEIEATAPDRELPEDLTQDMVGFVELLDSVYEILNDSEMFGQQVRTIMMELQENPEYEKLISDTDVHVMIRAMRNTMGLAKIRKQAKKRTTSTASGRARKPSRKQALMDKALNLSIGMDID